MPYYWGQPGFGATNAPTFRASDLAWRADPGMQNEAGNQIGGYTGWTASDPYGGRGENWYFGGTQDSPALYIKGDGKYAGMRYDYTRGANGDWIPGQGVPVSMGGPAFGPDFWGPVAVVGGGYLAGSALAGAGGGSLAGAGEAGLAGGTAGAGGAAAGGGGAAAGVGAGAGGAAAVGGGGSAAGGGAAAGGGSGLFGTGLNGGQLVQLGSLGYGLLGGGNRGNGTASAGGALNYTGAPMAPLSQIRGPQPTPQMPVAQNIDPRQGAANVWNQYSQGLLLQQMPPMASQPGGVKLPAGMFGGGGMQVGPVNRTPGLL